MRVVNKSMSTLHPLTGRGVLIKRSQSKRGMGLLPYSGFGKVILPARGCSKMSGSGKMQKMPGYDRGKKKYFYSKKIGGQFFKPLNMTNNPGELVGPQSAGPLA